MKKLIAVLFCAGYLINAQGNSTITIEFQKDSEKFTEGTVRALSIYAEELYLAKGIKVTLQEPSRNAEAKKQALFYKRERELKEFFKEENLNFERISFNYEQEGKKKAPVISIEIVPHAVVAEIIRPDSTFTNKNKIPLTCKYHDLELANEMSVVKLNSQEELYNSNVSSFFDNKIIFIRELFRVEFPEGKMPTSGVTAEIVQGAENAKKQFTLLHWNNINKEWTKIGATKKPTKGASGYYFSATFEESGLYAIVENKSTSVVPVVAKAKKDVAITYIEILSTEPFLRIEGDVSDNQREATFKAPKNIENYVIRAVCKDAQGTEWIEQTKVSKKTILRFFQKSKKINAYFNN